MAQRFKFRSKDNPWPSVMNNGLFGKRRADGNHIHALFSIFSGYKSLYVTNHTRVPMYASVLIFLHESMYHQFDRP